MKQKLLLALTLVFFTSFSVFADQPVTYMNDYEVESTEDDAPQFTKVDEDEDVETVTFEGLKDLFSYWSFTLEAGLNRFDGDITQDYNDLLPSSTTQLTLGGSAEYTLSSAWSLGLDYYYLPLRGETKYANFTGTMHSVSLFSSFNLVKAFLPYSKTKWGIWTSVGLGAALYDSEYKTSRNGQRIKGGNGAYYVDNNSNIDDGRVAFIPVGFLAEYNFTENLAVGLKAQIRSFNKDYIERKLQLGVSNDVVEFATLQARWKITNGREKFVHKRNETVQVDYRSEIDALQEKVDNIVIPPASTYDDERINNLERRVKKMEDILCPDGPDDDNDGVPNCRDQEPQTPAGTQVDFWGRTIGQQQVEQVLNDDSFITFDFDKTGLNNESHRAIAICARKMKADPELIVEVRGFTDNVGTDEYNTDLSLKRANVVKEELVKTYGIEEDRVIANGKGKYNPKDKSVPFRPYRTCVLFYNK